MVRTFFRLCMTLQSLKAQKKNIQVHAMNIKLHQNEIYEFLPHILISYATKLGGLPSKILVESCEGLLNKENIKKTIEIYNTSENIFPISVLGDEKETVLKTLQELPYINLYKKDKHYYLKEIHQDLKRNIEILTALTSYNCTIILADHHGIHWFRNNEKEFYPSPIEAPYMFINAQRNHPSVSFAEIMLGRTLVYCSETTSKKVLDHLDSNFVKDLIKKLLIEPQNHSLKHEHSSTLDGIFNQKDSLNLIQYSYTEASNIINKI